MTEKKRRTGRNGRGRPFETEFVYNFDPKDLKVVIFRSYTNARAEITHIPTGIVVEGHDPTMPGSTLSARVFALQELSRLLKEQGHETIFARS